MILSTTIFQLSCLISHNYLFCIVNILYCLQLYLIIMIQYLVGFRINHFLYLKWKASIQTNNSRRNLSWIPNNYYNNYSHWICLRHIINWFRLLWVNPHFYFNLVWPQFDLYHCLTLWLHSWISALKLRYNPLEIERHFQFRIIVHYFQLMLLIWYELRLFHYLWLIFIYRILCVLFGIIFQNKPPMKLT